MAQGYGTLGVEAMRVRTALAQMVGDAFDGGQIGRALIKT